MASSGQPGEEKIGEDGIAVETMKDCCKNAITSVFDEESRQPYNHNDAQQWVARICEFTLEKCMKLKKPFKYIVNCVIVKKVGAGLHLSSSSHFSPTDGSVCEVYDVNTELFVAVTLWWMSL
jgi:dynein light chain Tctex-type 1